MHLICFITRNTSFSANFLVLSLKAFNVSLSTDYNEAPVTSQYICSSGGQIIYWASN